MLKPGETLLYSSKLMFYVPDTTRFDAGGAGGWTEISIDLVLLLDLPTSKNQVKLPAAQHLHASRNRLEVKDVLD